MADNQQNRNDSNLFENMPNEIIITIFSYITCTDAVIAFSNLNSRFQGLLKKSCLRFDLTFVSKTHFDIVFQNQDTNQWQSLKLSNDKYTSGQVNYFFQNYALTLNNFSQLQDLSIVKIKPEYPYPIFTQLPSLSNLVSLEIESICGKTIPEIDLPNLKKLKFSSCSNTSWLENFTRLETIDYTIINCCAKDNDRLVWPYTLKHLKIIYETYQDCLLIQQSLSNLSQLNDLELYQREPQGIFPRGEAWQRIITTSNPSLKNFNFYFQFLYNDTNFNQLKQAIASFSTPFYASENDWSVCCDVSHYETLVYDPQNGGIQTNLRHAILYTIPFSFEIFKFFKIYTKRKHAEWSRNSIDFQKSNMSAKMKTLVFQSYSTPDPMFDRSSITNLIINTTFDAQPWINIFTNVRNMIINDGTLISAENFNIFLNHAPHLCSLSITKSMLKVLTDNWTDICVWHHLSHKIHSLTFTDEQNPSQCFDRNELEKVLPIFTSQCQHLSLGVQSHSGTIAFILNKMLNLISLHVYIQRKNCPQFTVEWLEQQNTRFNRTNCILTNVPQGCHFWLG